MSEDSLNNFHYNKNTSIISSYEIKQDDKEINSFNDKNSISSIICIYNFFSDITLCISNNLTIYSFGHSECGSHGHNFDFIEIPKEIKELNDIIMISAGCYHSIFIDNYYNIYSIGSNTYGQLGIGKTGEELQFTYKPQQLNLPPINKVSCGDNFTICLSEDGLVYSFGYNLYGQLGHGNKINLYSPKIISDLNNITFISCGGDHVFCKNSNNEYYCWGYNKHGQLGQGTNTNINKPIFCSNWPYDIIDIKAAKYYTLILTFKGQIYSFGINDYGKLGLNDKSLVSSNIPTLIEDIPEIQRIECGDHHSMCIDINNNLWLFGYNLYGQLGLGDKRNRYKPIKHPTLSNIIDISSGGLHTFVKTFNNEIYAFGYNRNFQLGIVTEEEKQLTPIRVFKNNEDIWCSTIGKSRAKSARK